MTKLVPWGCVLLVLVGMVCPVSSFASEGPPPRDCRLKQLASIDLQIGSLVVMPVVLDGAPALMGLTTTNPFSTISKQSAAEMKLAIAKTPAPISGIAGFVSIDSFLLGSLEIGKVQLLVNNWPMILNSSVPPYIGFFALASLVGMDYELDFAHNKLNLFTTTHCAGNVVYWTDSAASVPYSLDKMGLFAFPMELDGKKIAATMEMGAHTWLRTDISKALYGFNEHSSGIRTETLDSGKTINHYRAMKMTARGLSVINADVVLTPGSKGCSVSYNSGPEHSAAYENCYGPQPLMLGLDVLRHLRLYFATQEHILYFTAADAGMPAPAKEE